MSSMSVPSSAPVPAEPALTTLVGGVLERLN